MLHIQSDSSAIATFHVKIMLVGCWNVGEILGKIVNQNLNVVGYQ